MSVWRGGESRPSCSRPLDVRPEVIEADGYGVLTEAATNLSPMTRVSRRLSTVLHAVYLQVDGPLIRAQWGRARDWWNRRPELHWGLTGLAWLVSTAAYSFFVDSGAFVRSNLIWMGATLSLSAGAVAVMLAAGAERLSEAVVPEPLVETPDFGEALFRITGVFAVGLLLAIAAVGTEALVFWWTAAFGSAHHWIAIGLQILVGFYALVAVAAAISAPFTLWHRWASRRRRLAGVERQALFYVAGHAGWQPPADLIGKSGDGDDE